jgi:hypothetical protein
MIEEIIVKLVWVLSWLNDDDELLTIKDSLMEGFRDWDNWMKISKKHLDVEETYDLDKPQENEKVKYSTTLFFFILFVKIMRPTLSALVRLCPSQQKSGKIENWIMKDTNYLCQVGLMVE